MEVIRTNSWAEFERELRVVRERYGVYRRELSDGQLFERRNMVLFRGQENETWPLLTTLERKSNRQFNVMSYMSLALRARNELESFTGHTWTVPPYPEVEREIRDKQDPAVVHLPAYDFLVYLRHHGYPSPLLDWTESPYIAAYFACLNSGHADPAIYCYIERPHLTKGGSVGDALLSVMGPFVSTDKRHFAQRAWYTIATRWRYEESSHYFCKHEEVFSRNDEKQDVLVKIVLSAEARLEVLRALSDYNINHFTLFQSEDALVRALELRHFDLNEA